MYNIGILGRGFVGSAVAFGFSPSTGYNNANIRIFDIDSSKATHTLEEVVNKSDFIFVSVPTPSNSSGEINLNILNDCLESIENSVSNDSSPIILIRSTVVPGTSEKLSNKYKKLKIVFNPEFLTERSANYDFITQSRYILGGDPENTNLVAALLKDRFGKSVNILHTNFESAELIKYMCNVFLATKVSFMNEMFLLSKKSGAIWDDVLEGFIRDGRIGPSHTSVPGHDGRLGFGGSCFPKDIQAIIAYGKQLDIDLNTIEGAWKTNLEVRPEKDWESLKGRAISDD
jgi:UDPglucose 6-dehydrogenase